MGIFDIIILVIIIVAAVTGAMRGLVLQIGSIVGLLAAIVVCRLFGSTVTAYFTSPGSPNYTAITVVVYILLFIVSYVGVILLARLLGGALSAVKLRPLDRVAGALFRVCAWLVLCSVALNAYFAACPGELPTFKAGRPWRSALVKLAPDLMGYIVNPFV